MSGCSSSASAESTARTSAVLKALEAGLLHRPDFGRTST
jgi:hypothetical protein